MNPGLLNERVAHHVRSSTTSGGVTAPVFTAGSTVWARIAPLKAHERVRAGRSDALTQYRLTLRRPLPSAAVPVAADRFIWGSVTLEATGVFITEDKAYYTVEAVAP